MAAAPKLPVRTTALPLCCASTAFLSKTVHFLAVCLPQALLISQAAAEPEPEIRPQLRRTAGGWREGAFPCGTARKGTAPFLAEPQGKEPADDLGYGYPHL
eukprot:SAG22_NODE_1999_length_3178_cov_12.473530_2_plen_101_part_00